MPYYIIKVNLLKNQSASLINALQSMEPVSITFRPSQFNADNGDNMLFTKTQINKIQTALVTRKNVSITFSKTQLKTMHSQVGNGILDSVSNFFKNSFNSAKNWVSSKISSPKPQTTRDRYMEMKKIENAKPKTPTNAELAKQYKNSLKPKYNPGEKRIDYGQEYDNHPPDFKPAEKTITDKVVGFDNMISNIFKY